MNELKDTVKTTCPRCKGNKHILGQVEYGHRGANYKLPNYRQVKKGICFLCDGEGEASYSNRFNAFLKEKNGALLKYDNKGEYSGMVQREFELPTFDYSGEPPTFDEIDDALRIHEIEMLRVEETEIKW